MAAIIISLIGDCILKQIKIQLLVTMVNTVFY